MDWQTTLNKKVVAFPGFVSLEILSPTGSVADWLTVQRFYSVEQAKVWRQSQEYQALLEELKGYVSEPIEETELEASDLQGGVTEVFVTEVNPDEVKAYQDWLAKIHRVEATFPGFRGVYVQSPSSVQGKNWITLLQFDTPANLDRWLLSPERQKVLKESKPLIASLESHRVISPYAGWFSSLAKKGSGSLPPVWKQTMLVLLVLFPIVMLELRFLSPWLAAFNSALATFIGNAISVSLISWPMMPIAIKFLDWWLTPETHPLLKTLLGTLLVLLLYLLEIALLWTLLK